MKQTIKEQKMTNKNVTFCITGALESYKRNDAVKLVEAKTNAKFVSKVSSNTDYLVSMSKDTVKAKRAKQFGTIVIDEAEMLVFIKKGKFPQPKV